MLRGSGRFVGQEIDVAAGVRPGKRWKLEAGYSYFAPGAFVRRTGDSAVAQWAFLQEAYSLSRTPKLVARPARKKAQ